LKNKKNFVVEKNNNKMDTVDNKMTL